MAGTARDKLNAATITGSALIAGVAGFIGQSWSVFLFTFVLLLATSYIAGDMRLARKRDEDRSKK